MEKRVRDGIKLLEAIKAEILKNQPDENSPSSIIEREMQSAESWVQDHIGEFQSKCPSCGDMLTVPALPHWAFESMETSHGTEWPVWSRELFDLLSDGLIEPWMMAYVLRTSIEGLKQTAQRRLTLWPEVDIYVQEQKLKRQMLVVKP